MKHQYIYWSLKIWKQKFSLNYSARTSFDYASCNTEVHSFFSTTSLEMETPLLSLALFFPPLQLTYYPLAMYMREKERERERDALVSFEGVSVSKSHFSSAFHMGNERIGRANQQKTIVKKCLPPFIHSKTMTHFCLHLLQHI